MLKLKNVSKFYYANGIITSGFTKVNLELHRGEFVAITGESGSGKSTLLNVISGLDSYEEGEMYINGEETSAYSNADFENYRNRYIANIYQAFNLINSYTVYQNVDLVLRLNGTRRSQRRARVLDVLKKVGLYEFRRAKASRLSGGQKQRVAIARALVKDTPIIVADEPTGNLDSESAANVIRLLSELASDRLVVVVTHSYEQVEPYVTRKITMHDGRITEDLVLREPEAAAEPETAAAAEEAAAAETERQEPAATEEYTDTARDRRRGKKHLGFLSRIRLGLRNTFNVVPKFLLILFIFLFLCASVTAFYSNIREQQSQTEAMGYNYFFNNSDEARIVIKKKDGTPISDGDIEALKRLPNVASVFVDDVLLDNGIYMSCDEMGYYVDGRIALLEESGLTAADLSCGTLPADDNSVVVLLNADHYLNDGDAMEQILGAEFVIHDNYTGDSVTSAPVRVSGMVFRESDDWQGVIYMSKGLMDAIRSSVNANYSTMTVTYNGEEHQVDRWSPMNRVVPSDSIQPGCCMVSDDLKWEFPRGKIKDKPLDVKVKNLYYSDTAQLKITDTYNKRNFTAKTGFNEYDWYNGIILMNRDEYNAFFDKESFQSSVFVQEPLEARDTVEELERLGYKALYIKDTLKTWDAGWMVVEKIFNTIASVVLMAAMFLISYFIIKLIMRSRNVYFATLRMLGGTAGDSRSLLVVELLTVMNLAFLLSIGFILLTDPAYTFTGWLGTAAEYLRMRIDFDWLNTIHRFLHLKDYLILYVILCGMSVLVALGYARQLFKTTAMNVYKEA